jgi:aldose sugar dehydrogenase
MGIGTMGIGMSRRGPRALGVALVVGLIAACGAGPAITQDVHRSEEHAFRVVTVAEGLEHPWALAFLPGGDMLVSERPGRLRLIREGELLPDPVPGGPEVAASGQGGLLDLALHPDFETGRLVYMSYAKRGPDGLTTAVARARLENDRLHDLEDVLVADAWGGTGRHFGSRIAFDHDGFLYLTIGDRGQMDRAQDTSDHAGTTLRLHDDGSVPEDNPFVGDPNVRDEIYTYGNRNAQGMVVHPTTGEIWQNEHGPRGGDKINLIEAGLNYGWPVITYGTHYDGTPITDRTHAPGMEQPVVDWTPSIAPSGMAVYTGDAFPGWQGDVFNGALAGQHLRRVVLDGREAVHEESLLQGLARIRDVRDGPDGHLYILTDHASGVLARLEPAD